MDKYPGLQLDEKEPIRAQNGPIGTMTNDILGRLSGLEKELALLGETLSPILNPGRSIGADDSSGENDEPDSPHLSQLKSVHSSIIQLTDRVRSLRAKVEL